jgi:hypothetical protein
MIGHIACHRDTSRTSWIPAVVTLGDDGADFALGSGPEAGEMGRAERQRSPEPNRSSTGSRSCEDLRPGGSCALYVEHNRRIERVAGRLFEDRRRFST